MLAESVHSQISVAQGSRKVVPRTRTGYCNDLSPKVLLQRCMTVYMGYLQHGGVRYCSQNDASAELCRNTSSQLPLCSPSGVT